LGQTAPAGQDALAALVLASRSRFGWPEYAAAEAESGDAAAAAGDWARAREHFALAALWQPSHLDHLRRQAWVEWAMGDTGAYRRTSRRLLQKATEAHGLAPLFHLSAALTCSSPGGIILPCGRPVAESALRQLDVQQAAAVVRATVLAPDSSLAPNELLSALDRVANSWAEPREAAALKALILYRAGDVSAAAAGLETGGNQSGIPNQWAWPALAQVLIQSGHKHQAASREQVLRHWQQASPPASWEEGIIRRQLLAELEEKKP
jgi:hypothetical protein